jgi:hypothetical protein
MKPDTEENTGDREESEKVIENSLSLSIEKKIENNRQRCEQHVNERQPGGFEVDYLSGKIGRLLHRFLVPSDQRKGAGSSESIARFAIFCHFNCSVSRRERLKAASWSDTTGILHRVRRFNGSVPVENSWSIYPQVI